MLFFTLAEYDQAIAETRASISRTLESVQYSSDAGGIGVGNRRVELAELRAYLSQLMDERGSLDPSSSPGTGPGRIYAGNGRRF